MFTGVCLSTGGLFAPEGVSAVGGGLCFWGGEVGCLLPEGCMVPGEGVCSRGEVLGGDPPTATAAGCTHPTGMPSCLARFLSKFLSIFA